MRDVMEAMPKVQVLEAKKNGSVAVARFLNNELLTLSVNGKYWENNAKGFYENMTTKQGVVFELVKEELSEDAVKIYNLIN